MDLGIKGKRALVLASSQGLGLGIATKLCEEGASVIVTGRSTDACEAMPTSTVHTRYASSS